MAGEVSDEEAAWRDLVAHYSRPEVTGAAPPWPVREDLPAAPATAPGASGRPGGGEQADPEEPAQQAPPVWADPVPGVIPAPPQMRIIRPATPAPLPAAGDDEHFVPPAPPPLPPLDPVSKGAWTALFGGPGYLLVAVLLGWVVPGWAAFCAVAAFVGGFAILVVRMGDRPPRDSGPDDGAVV